MKAQTITLDVREDLRTGKHPFDKIQNALQQISPNQALRLIVPFEPVPLFRVAAQQGFRHEAAQTPDGYWEVLFRRGASAGAPSTKQQRDLPPTTDVPCGGEFVEVDARGLEPPQPMVKILETLASIPEGTSLRARTDRRPVHLYSRLEERGYASESIEQEDGSFVTHISRR